MSGPFEDLMYPDNTNRAKRTQELANDCVTLAAQLASDKETIDLLLKDSSQAIKDAYGNIARDPVGLVTVNLDKGADWVTYIPEVISPIVVMEITVNALHTAAKAWLVNQGRIGEAAFADLVGLPRWLTFGKYVGGIAAATAAAVAITALIDAYEGSEQRDALRKAIHELIPARVNIKKNAMINETLRLTLQSVINAFTAIKNVPSIQEEQLGSILNNMIASHKVSVEAITEDVVKKTLADLDNKRHSWTNED
jgi:hypothetical protein